jgi:lysophospholipase L1-like esterase
MKRIHVVTAVLFVLAGPTLAAQSGTEHWVGTWATSGVARPQTPPPPAPALPPFMANACPVVAPAAPPVVPPPGQTFAPPSFVHFMNQTLRQMVHTSLGGSKVRVLLSNVYGTAPLTIGAAHIALRDKESAIRPGSGRTLTFSGRPTITVPANAVAYSDPVDLVVPPASDLAIDVYLPGSTNSPSPLTFHQAALQTNYVSETGNHVGAASMPTVAALQNWVLLSRVDVLTPAGVAGLVTFGDSITDGARSTPDTNKRWPDQLVRRAAARSGGPRLAIMNAGIAGNRVLSEGVGVNALARFDIDALNSPGVTHIVVLEGINDIGQARQNPTPTAADLIAGHKQLIERAHAKGLRIYGATLTPFYGAAYYTVEGEAKRQALNDWIRNGKAYDAVIDFDMATRDPNDPKKLAAAYDSCDHLHPNDAGYKAMADAVDLELFATPFARQ